MNVAEKVELLSYYDWKREAARNRDLERGTWHWKMAYEYEYPDEAGQEGQPCPERRQGIRRLLVIAESPGKKKETDGSDIPKMDLDWLWELGPKVVNPEEVAQGNRLFEWDVDHYGDSMEITVQQRRQIIRWLEDLSENPQEADYIKEEIQKTLLILREEWKDAIHGLQP